QGGDINAWVLGETATFDGSGSTDADDDDLQYRWTFSIRGSETTVTGNEAEIENANQAIATFTPNQSGNYYVELTVYDGTEVVRSGYTTLKVNTLPEGHVNTAPVAVIGTNWSTGTYEIETATRPSISSRGYDKESSSVYSLVREWSVTAAPEGVDLDAINAELAGVTGIYMAFETPGTYTIKHRLSDGELYSEVEQDFEVLYGANNAPDAVASTSTKALNFMVEDTITFDASGSTDDRDHQMSAFDWVLVNKPDGSEAELVNADTETPTLTLDKAGPYSVKLRVQDALGAWSGYTGVTIKAKSENNVPIARPTISQEYDDEQPFVIYPTVDARVEEWSVEDDNRAAGLAPWEYRYLFNTGVTFSGDAYDPDGDSVVYLWSLVNEPDNATFARAQSMCLNGYIVNAQGEYRTPQDLYQYVINAKEWSCANVPISPATEGNYELQLITTDGMSETSPVSISFPAVYRANYPTLLLEDTYASESNGADLTLGNSDYLDRQQLFPYHFVQRGSFPIFDSYLDLGTSTMVKRYQLSAFDQDYTITNLQAVSQAEGGYQVSFSGLTDGQVIKQGESIFFELIITTPDVKPDEILIIDENFNWASKDNQAKGISFSFEIAEKTGWTFTYEPYIYLTGCQGCGAVN
ncbi:PKD domain-containing protein, partial [Catenovulum sp. 2E275]|uniref:PKD domain-containing protein n=1 Tax=Catenovulum sp. 2E275 TaxID=2980497 RepID=UPI0021D2F14D|nr:PKD domain-containing protein [Catenovulum sp. 2E275]